MTPLHSTAPDEPSRDAPKAVVAATPDDIQRVAAVIASAFQHLDVAHWLITEPADREPVLAANMEIWVRHAFETGGIIDMTADRQGVAVWFVNTGEPPTPPPDYESRLTEACGRYAANFRTLDQAFEDNHPQGRAHHHLAFMAVRPGRQGNGYGTDLLNWHYRQFPDVSSYLEASCPASRNLYRRNGFRDNSAPFVLPGGPPMWPMWRETSATTRPALS